MDHDYMVHLEDLSLSELQEIVEDEDKINQFILDDDTLKKYKLERELILAENRSIADDNLGKEPVLQQLKSDLEQKYSEVKQIHDTYQLNQAKIASLGKGDSLDAMLAILQAKSAECEEKTEVIAKRFNDKELDTDSFMTEFKETRRLAHLRQVKVDKMKGLVMEVQRNHVSNPAPYNPPPRPMERTRNTSIHSPNQPAPAAPYPSYPGYGPPPQHSTSAYPHPQQAYPHPQQAYPEYSW